MVDLELRWLGYFLVREGILEPQQVRDYATNLGGDVDFVDYAQTLLDNDVVDDYEALQNLVDRAFAAGKNGDDPPVNIFAPPPPPTAPPTPPAPPLRIRMTTSSLSVAPAKAPTEAADAAELVTKPKGLPPRPKPKAIPLQADPGESTANLTVKRVASASANEPSLPPGLPEPPTSRRPPPSPGVAKPSLSQLDGPLPEVNSAAGRSPAEAGEILARLLLGARQQQASDLHLSAGARPFLRSSLKNVYLEETVVSPAAAEALNLAFLTAEQRQAFDQDWDLDYLLAFDQKNRFRVNLMRHREGIAGTYRLVPQTVRPLAELGFRSADVIAKMLDHHNGLILVTGPVGAGKTTTLGALVDILNRQRTDHIICVEDPIEVVQPSAQCNVTQREVGRHTRSFASALKGALREDPDIIVIGEMRDLQTIEMAITAAETGHLVIGTLHTSDAATTLNRILDVFPPSQQAQIRSMTSESLRGIICQRLIPATDGGVTLAEEVLVSTVAVSNIIREGRMHQLKQVLQTGSQSGMCTMDQSLFTLWQEGRISTEVAMSTITDSELTRRIRTIEAEAEAQANGKKKKAKPAPPVEAGDEKQKKGWFR